MSNKSGLLLEHFARLAANVAGTPAAVVGVVNRRTDHQPMMAAFGLPRDFATAAAELDRAFASGPRLTIVPDVRLDLRVGSTYLASECSHFRFVGHLKLSSAGGERIGFICVLDESSRPDLTEHQAASLADIASLIIADRRREQRHLHLMHVANRALRVDKMLHVVAEAASCSEALINLLEEICRFHGAAIGQIGEMMPPDGAMREVSRYVEGSGIDKLADHSLSAMTIASLAAEAMRRNKPHVIRASGDRSSGPIEIIAGTGLSSQVCVPFRVQQQRFVILLAFIERPDLDAVVADIASLADTIRPALLRKVTEDRIRFFAHHDDLTQLPNRLMFRERLDSALAAGRTDGQGFAVLYLDLDGFKIVNDTLGHEIGDKLLAAAAQRLLHNVREGDTVARMGGDEFAIIQLSENQPAAAAALADRLVHAISRPFDFDGKRPLISASVGIAVHPEDGETPDLLLRSADMALYRAKAAGRNTVRLSDPVVHVRQHERYVLEQDMKNAVEGRQFTLAYQPVCDGESLHIIGFEALLRWNHPSRGQILPDRFIPLAESSGLIVPVGRWVMETACTEAAAWELPVSVSVNLSPVQFRQPDLIEQIAYVLDRTRLPADRLELEVTEGLLLDESGAVVRTMQRLQEQGIRITLDDFGTAYASLSYLRRFPFDSIKIDRSFTHGICNDKDTFAIVKTVLSLGAQLNLRVVAEGVETERELEALRRLGCRVIQGYISGRPVSEQHARELLRRQRDSQGGHEIEPACDATASGWTRARSSVGFVPAVRPAPNG